MSSQKKLKTHLFARVFLHIYISIWLCTNFIYAFIFQYLQIVFFALLLLFIDKSEYVQLFRQRLSHESVKAYATMPICIMGSKNLALLD